MFVSQCERPCFTPIQNDRQIYSSAYLKPTFTNTKTDRRVTLKAGRGSDESFTSPETMNSNQTWVNTNAQGLLI